MSLSRYFSASKIRDYLIENTSLIIFNILNDALISENAYIAGGSILSCYTEPKFKTYDLDIYVNQRNFNNLIVKLNEIYNFTIEKDINIAPPYDDSFFKKNNILFRVRGKSFTVIKIPSIDIMVIPDEINITDVLSNFDLTICEIWYNGRTINGTSLADIKNKVGYLRKEYNDSLFKHLNTFIIKRIKKYRERGFKIKYEIPRDRQLSTTIDINKKTLTNPNEWVIKKFLRYFRFNIHTRYYINYKRQINKSNKPNSLLYPYNSLIKKENIDVKLYIFMNSLNKFDNYDLLLENLNKYFLIKNPRDFVNKTLKYFYKILIDTNYSPEYINYIEQLTDLRGTYSRSSSYNSNKYECVPIMEKHIKQYDEFIIVNSTNKSEYEKLKIKNEDKCYDVFLVEDIKITNSFTEDEIIFVINNKFFCYSKDNLNKLATNHLDNWFCECTGPVIEGTNDKRPNKFDLENIYIKIPLDINIYILYKYLLFILNNKYSVYFLYFQKTINHSVSFKNTNSRTAQYVGANHCQFGSEINIYDIKYCDIK